MKKIGSQRLILLIFVLFSHKNTIIARTTSEDGWKKKQVMYSDSSPKSLDFAGQFPNDFDAEMHKSKLPTDTSITLKSINLYLMSVGLFENALVSCHLNQAYLDSVRTNIMIERKPAYTTKKIQSEKEKIFFRALQFAFILVLLLFLISCMTVYFLIIKNHRVSVELSKRKEFEINREHKAERIKKFLFQRFEVSKEIIVMSSRKNQKDEKTLRKINEIIYGVPIIEPDWGEFYELLSELHGNLLIKLRGAFPRLTDDDIHFCSLLQAGFETGEIAFILNFASNTIRMKKTSLRKKIGITNGGNMNNYFEEFLKNFEG